jgi:hypothetical protein
MIASAMARAADQKIATVTGRLTDTGIVCDRLMDGSIIVGHLTRMPVIKSIQSMKNGFDPVGIQVSFLPGNPHGQKPVVIHTCLRA